jgi:cell division protein FtsW (lipid II flippase)
MSASTTFDRARTRYLDFYIVVVTLALTGFGILAIYSANGAGALTPGSLPVRQLVYFVVGVGLMVAFSSSITGFSGVLHQSSMREVSCCLSRCWRLA